MNEIRLGSLFDGIGVFPLAAVRCGIEPVWVEMSRNVQSGNTQNLKSPFVNQAACCACAHSRYFTGGSPSGLRV